MSAPIGNGNNGNNVSAEGLSKDEEIRVLRTALSGRDLQIRQLNLRLDIAEQSLQVTRQQRDETATALAVSIAAQDANLRLIAINQNNALINQRDANDAALGRDVRIGIYSCCECTKILSCFAITVIAIGAVVYAVFRRALG